MAQLQRMKPEVYVSVLIAKAKQKQVPLSDDQLKALGGWLLQITQELYGDSVWVMADPERSQLWRALWQQAQQAQQNQNQQQPPQAQVPQAAPQQQPPQAQPPGHPAQSDINGPTPLPPAASGRIHGAPNAPIPGPGNAQNAPPPRSGLTSNPPHPVPVQAPMMPRQPGGGNGQQPAAPALEGHPNAPVNPNTADSPPSMTVPPPPPPAFD